MARPLSRVDIGWIVSAVIASVTAGGLMLALGTPATSPPDIVQFVGRLHPLAVHLPIGFLFLVALVEVGTLWRGARERLDPAMGLALPPVLATALGAFLLGWLAARTGAYPRRTVTIHGALALATIVGTSGCLAAWVEHRRRGGARSRATYRAVLVATVALIGAAGHYGGELTHGAGYLTRYAPGFVRRMLGLPPNAEPASPAPVATAPGADPLLYVDVLGPLLQSRCRECHGPDKASGGLRVDDLAAVRKGGGEGPGLVPGRATASSIYARAALPASDDGHMPPAGRPSLSADQVELLGWWIDRGASEAQRVRDALPPDGARRALAEAASATPTAAGAAPAAATSEPSATAAASAEPPTAETAGSPSAVSSGSPASSAQASQSAWDAAISPMLQSSCGRCHGAAKQKGKLRVDSLQALLAGGRQGVGIVPGHPEQGTVLARMRLPLGNDDRMPPSDEPQPSHSDVELLAWWVGGGANAQLPASQIPAALRPKGPSRSASAHPTGPPSAPSSDANAAPSPNVGPTRGTARPTSTPADTATAGTPTAATAGTTAAAAAGTPAAATAGTPAAAAAGTTGAGAAGTSTAATAALPAQVQLFRDGARPVLGHYCGSCHSGSGASAGLDVDNLAAMISDGQVMPGNSEHSSLLGRMLLPTDDSDHMPPGAMPQPPPDEIELVRLWIDRGAREDLVVDRGDVPPAAAGALARIAAVGPGAAQPSPANDAAPRAPGDRGSLHGPPPVPPVSAAGCEACAMVRGQRSAALAAFFALGISMGLLRRRSTRRPRPRA